MKILYIHQYFKTPDEPGGTRSYWFAKELLENGCQVTMLTSRGQQKKLIEHEIIEGIDVIYIRNPYHNKMGVLRRLFSFFRFMLLSTIVALRQKNISLIYATSTPLTIGIPALICKMFKRTPYVFEVRDLWPEVPIQMGALKNSFLIKFTKKIEKVLYEKAEHVIALSPGMKNGILQCNIDENKVSMLPNMSKVDEFYPREKNIEMMKKYNLEEDHFHVIHFGAMGLANGLDYIMDGAKIIQENRINSIRILFAGEGGQEYYLKERCDKEEIRNVMFLGNFNMQGISDIVNIADCSVVSFSNLPILKTNSPNKLFDSLSAGKPIIVNSAGWTKKMVEENNCGIFVNPDFPEELADTLIDWSINKEKLVEKGENARKLAVNTYDKGIISKEFVSVISTIV